MRYDYGFYSTQAKAEMALEDMYADGEVSSGEAPKIVKRSTRTRQSGTTKSVFVVTLEDWS